MTAMTREELAALQAIKRIPDAIDRAAAEIKRLAEAVEFAADKAPPKKEANDGD